MLSVEYYNCLQYNELAETFSIIKCFNNFFLEESKNRDFKSDKYWKILGGIE